MADTSSICPKVFENGQYTDYDVKGYLFAVIWPETGTLQAIATNLWIANDYLAEYPGTILQPTLQDPYTVLQAIDLIKRRLG